MQYTQGSPSSQGSELIPTKHAIRSTATIVVGKIVSFIASFAAITVLGNVIPRETVGTYNYIIAIFTIISITTLPGMNNALARSVSKGFDGNVSLMLKKRFIFGAFGILISIGIGLYFIITGNSHLGIAFLIIAPFVPLTDTLSNFTTSFWQGKKDFKKSAFFGAVYYVTFGLFNIGVFLITKNIYFILFGVLLGQTIAGWLVFKSIKKENNLTDHASVNLGYHLTFMQGFKTFVGNFDRIIVWHIAGPAMVAAYSFAAAPFFKSYQLIPIGTISLPHLSNHSFTPQTKSLVIKKVLFLFVLTIPVAVCAILLAPFVYRHLFPLYPESVHLFQILIASIIFAPTLMLDAALTAFHKTKILYITELLSPIVRITLMIILGIRFGLLGIVFATLITSIFDFIITFILFIFSQTESLEMGPTGKKL